LTNLAAVTLATSTPRAIGLVIFAVAIIGFIVYAAINVRLGRDEIGAELELAPNRKPYLSDEQLEGPKLDKTLSWGLITLAVVAVGLPLYWLNEPGRQTGAIEEFERVYATRGSELFAPTAEGGFNCAGCHGEAGVGGVAPFTLTDSSGKFVASVSWRAPALNTVLLRYSRKELTYILTYGRPFSPMPAWGVAGGGAMNDQQLKNLVDYLASIQITSAESKDAVALELAKALKLYTDADLKGLDAKAQAAVIAKAIKSIDYGDAATGEALFNLGRESGFAGGAYACGRCHTRGWSIVAGTQSPAKADISEFTPYPDGSGAMGPALRAGVIPRQFLTVKDMIEFITLGSINGVKYGQNGQGTGKMPGFGDNPDDNAEDPVLAPNTTDDNPGDGMMSEDMIKAIVCYEATLDGSDPPKDCA
jgi:mono/diheme cytochrome c family protein